MQELGATPQGAAPGGAPGGGAAPPGGLQMLMSSLNQAGEANASVQTRRMNEL
jgi:hypothetical protein